MTTLPLKMLFLKKGTTSSTIALALLVAILASTTSIVNDINSQTETLGDLLTTGNTYLIFSQNSNSIVNSKIDAELADQLNGIADIEYTFPQKIFTATLTASSGNYTALIRGVENVTSFLELRRAYVNGTTAKSETEANVGEILARIVAIDLGDEVNLTVDNTALKVTVVGVVETLTQNDAELIVPMEAIHNLTGNDGKISIIEFTLQEDVKEEAILNIIKFLPTDVKVVKAHQLKEFMRDMNGQTLTFLNLWSIAVYVVVAAASYVVATRLVAESSYELAMVRALGAKKRLLLTLVLTYIAVVTLLGSILGVAFGTAGTQMASTMLRWIWTNVEVNSFLEPSQVVQTLLLTLASSTLGCLYPAFRCARKSYMEQPL